MPLRPLVALLAIFSACLASLSGATAKPNIVYILADDLGFAELGCNGADKFKTPNIDALANSGVRFTRFFTAPLCGPSRSLILTGRYAFRTGAVSQDACKSLVRTGEKAEQMIPTVLKQAGYATALIGKWGQLSPSGSPAEWGFEHDFHFKASGMYWNSARVKTMTDDGKVRGDPDSYVINGKTIPVKDNEYIPDLMHKDAVAWLEAHKNGPFFLYYSMAHVHGEILPTPDSLPTPAGEDAATRLARHYTDNINYMDKLVGKLMAELDRLKLRENTLIVFMGDNGTAKAHAPVATIGGKRLDGEKGSMKEGGGLVPFFATWPGVTPSGKVNANVADASDLLPTFAEVAGAPLPTGRVIDGRSLVSQFKGDTQSPRTWAYCQLSNNYYVREAGWKLDQSGTLYDMKDAPFKEVAVAADTKDEAALAAKARLSAALAGLNPAAGAKDEAGDGSGRSGNKEEKKKKKKSAKDAAK
ncbi:MAG: sulfatase-like hydrolase/transferase [Opitutales bacterium]|nr:sulfatase-like hydrolase/transferase [Opitutales bacterium]